MPVVLHYATAVKPVRVLDIGVGMGAYGFMLRQFLDVTHERIKPETWKTVIDGVEVFPAYENPVWSYAYSSINMGDVREVLPKLGEYDLIICADVLEHFPRTEAQQLVKDFLAKAPVLIATTPRFDYPQGAWGGNEAETHHCTLDSSDFAHLCARNDTCETAVYVCVRPGGPAQLVKQAARVCPAVKLPWWKYQAARVLRKLGL